MEWNGMEWNGMEWNGMEWNGMEYNVIHRRGERVALAREQAAPHALVVVRLEDLEAQDAAVVVEDLGHRERATAYYDGVMTTFGRTGGWRRTKFVMTDLGRVGDRVAVLDRPERVVARDRPAERALDERRVAAGEPDADLAEDKHGARYGSVLAW